MRPRVALVDDDRNILTSVSIALESSGFAVATYADGQAALEGLARAPADLVVLDIKMPRMDGLETLRRLRQVSDVPVVFLTSKDAEIDEVEGLKLGADDYIRKPFSLRLLIERLRTVLRRAEAARGGRSGAAGGPEAKPIERGALVLDTGRQECRWNGALVPLTVTEFLILESLAQRPGHVKSRAQLIEVAYDEEAYVDDRTIDSHIKRLRKKIRTVDPEFDGIETLYGAGYKYRMAGEG